MAPWQLVPADYDGICSWLVVDRVEEAGRMARPFMLLYAPDVSPLVDSCLKVTMRLYGLLEAANISPMGNYTGYAPVRSRKRILT